jgi:hypothetical protein
MHLLATFACVLTFAAFMPGAAPGAAAPQAGDASRAASEVSAQARPAGVRKRPRTQLRVYPRYPYRNYHTLDPLPYAIEYPGPNAVRHCVSRLVQEHRPSGTVIVPRTRCWWARR